jgi:hypothetical protein
MAERDLTSGTALLCASVFVLLSCGVGDVLLAVTESVLWPLVLGVTWVVIAAVVTGLAQAAMPSGPRTSGVPQVSADVAAPVRRS